jgi:hypothetical protein
VHKDVIVALALDNLIGELDVPSMDNNGSFRNFVTTLVKNGSDKGFTHQKKYQKLMEPIIEEHEVPFPGQHDRGDGSIDMVDYDSTDTDEDNQARQGGGSISKVQSLHLLPLP